MELPWNQRYKPQRYEHQPGWGIPAPEPQQKSTRVSTSSVSWRGKGRGKRDGARETRGINVQRDIRPSNRTQIHTNNPNVVKIHKRVEELRNSGELNRTGYRSLFRSRYLGDFEMENDGMRRLKRIHGDGLSEGESQLINDFRSRYPRLQDVFLSKNGMRPCSYPAVFVKCSAKKPRDHCCIYRGSFKFAMANSCPYPAIGVKCCASGPFSIHYCAQYAPTDVHHPWNIRDIHRCDKCNFMHSLTVKCRQAQISAPISYESWVYRNESLPMSHITPIQRETLAKERKFYKILELAKRHHAIYKRGKYPNRPLPLRPDEQEPDQIPPVQFRTDGSFGIDDPEESHQYEEIPGETFPERENDEKMGQAFKLNSEEQVGDDLGLDILSERYQNLGQEDDIGIDVVDMSSGQGAAYIEPADVGEEESLEDNLGMMSVDGMFDERPETSPLEKFMENIEEERESVDTMGDVIFDAMKKVARMKTDKEGKVIGEKKELFEKVSLAVREDRITTEKVIELQGIYFPKIFEHMNAEGELTTEALPHLAEFIMNLVEVDQNREVNLMGARPLMSYKWSDRVRDKGGVYNKDLGYPMCEKGILLEENCAVYATGASWWCYHGFTNSPSHKPRLIYPYANYYTSNSAMVPYLTSDDETHKIELPNSRLCPIAIRTNEDCELVECGGSLWCHHGFTDNSVSMWKGFAMSVMNTVRTLKAVKKAIYHDFVPDSQPGENEEKKEQGEDNNEPLTDKIVTPEPRCHHCLKGEQVEPALWTGDRHIIEIKIEKKKEGGENNNEPLTDKIVTSEPRHSHCSDNEPGGPALWLGNGHVIEIEIEEKKEGEEINDEPLVGKVVTPEREEIPDLEGEQVELAETKPPLVGSTGTANETSEAPTDNPGYNAREASNVFDYVDDSVILGQMMVSMRLADLSRKLYPRIEKSEVREISDLVWIKLIQLIAEAHSVEMDLEFNILGLKPLLAYPSKTLGIDRTDSCTHEVGFAMCQQGVESKTNCKISQVGDSIYCHHGFTDSPLFEPKLVNPYSVKDISEGTIIPKFTGGMRIYKINFNKRPMCPIGLRLDKKCEVVVSAGYMWCNHGFTDSPLIHWNKFAKMACSIVKSVFDPEAAERHNSLIKKASETMDILLSEMSETLNAPSGEEEEIIELKTEQAQEMTSETQSDSSSKVLGSLREPEIEKGAANLTENKEVEDLEVPKIEKGTTSLLEEKETEGLDGLEIEKGATSLPEKNEDETVKSEYNVDDLLRDLKLHLTMEEEKEEPEVFDENQEDTSKDPGEVIKDNNDEEREEETMTGSSDSETESSLTDSGYFSKEQDKERQIEVEENENDTLKPKLVGQFSMREHTNAAIDIESLGINDGSKVKNSGMACPEAIARYENCKVVQQYGYRYCFHGFTDEPNIVKETKFKNKTRLRLPMKYWNTYPVPLRGKYYAYRPNHRGVFCGGFRKRIQIRPGSVGGEQKGEGAYIVCLRTPLMTGASQSTWYDHLGRALLCPESRKGDEGCVVAFYGNRLWCNHGYTNDEEFSPPLSFRVEENVENIIQFTDELAQKYANAQPAFVKNMCPYSIAEDELCEIRSDGKYTVCHHGYTNEPLCNEPTTQDVMKHQYIPKFNRNINCSVPDCAGLYRNQTCDKGIRLSGKYSNADCEEDILSDIPLCEYRSQFGLGMKKEETQETRHPECPIGITFEENCGVYKVGKWRWCTHGYTDCPTYRYNTQRSRNEYDVHRMENEVPKWAQQPVPFRGSFMEKTDMFTHNMIPTAEPSKVKLVKKEFYLPLCPRGKQFGDMCRVYKTVENSLFCQHGYTDDVAHLPRLPYRMCISFEAGLREEIPKATYGIKRQHLYTVVKDACVVSQYTGSPCMVTNCGDTVYCNHGYGNIDLKCDVPTNILENFESLKQDTKTNDELSLLEKARKSPDRCDGVSKLKKEKVVGKRADRGRCYAGLCDYYKDFHVPDCALVAYGKVAWEQRYRTTERGIEKTLKRKKKSESYGQESDKNFREMRRRAGQKKRASKQTGSLPRKKGKKKNKCMKTTVKKDEYLYHLIDEEPENLSKSQRKNLQMQHRYLNCE